MPVETPPRIPFRKRPAPKNPESRWRTISQERIYGQRLLEAIKHARNSSQPSRISSSRTIKEAADSALALTAKGQTRWSRAILSRRWQKRKLWLKAGGKIRRCSGTRRLEKPAPSLSLSAAPQPRKKTAEKVGDRLRVLGRLVPGCRKLSTASLLEEAADYMAALEMQVKAMRTLADLLSATTLDSTVESRTT
ncbi:transcription factor bHLH149-like [Magnolia sinica]|uniref:transcription factor bHLH149-like n=1 Tax=Magnolia sinica TaxID=86752 RepID=UPI00265B134C|nr:transcription factor bHLH149-like [Magnolia sinica]